MGNKRAASNMTIAYAGIYQRAKPSFARAPRSATMAVRAACSSCSPTFRQAPISVVAEGDALYGLPSSIRASVEPFQVEEGRGWRYHPEVGFVVEASGAWDGREQELAVMQARFFKKIRRAVSSAVKSTVKHVAAPAVNWVKDAAKDTADWTKNAAKDAANWTENAAKDAWNWTENAAGDAWDWTENAANDIADSAQSLARDALEHAKNLGEIIADGASNLGGIAGDLFKGLGENFVDWAKGMVECAKKLDVDCMLKETLLALVRGAYRIGDSVMRMIKSLGNTIVRLGRAVMDIVGDIMRALARLANRLLEDLKIITLPSLDCPGEKHVLEAGAARFKGSASVPQMERMNKFDCPLQWYTKNTVKHVYVPNRLTTLLDMRAGDIMQIEAEAAPPEMTSQYPFLRRNIVTVVPDKMMLSGMGIVGNLVLGKTLGINIEGLLSVCYLPELERYCTNKPFRTGLYFTPGVRSKVLYRRGETPDIAFARNFGCSGYAGCQCEPTCSICPVLMTKGVDEANEDANLLMVQNPQHPQNMDVRYVGKDTPQKFAGLETRLQSNIVHEFINGGNELSTTQDLLYRASCVYPADAWKGEDADVMARHVQALAQQGRVPEDVFAGMMRVHCQQAASNPSLCPPDALGAIPNTCMRIMADPMCKEWWNGDMKAADGTPLVTELDRDQMRGALCGRFPHAPECDCMRTDVLEYKANNPYDETEKAVPCPPCGAVDDPALPPRCRVRCMAYRRAVKGAYKGGRPLACTYPACMAAGRNGNFQTAYTVATQENCATICMNSLNLIGDGIGLSLGRGSIMTVDSCGNSTASRLDPTVVDVSSGKFNYVLHTIGYVAAACFVAAVAAFALGRRARPVYGDRKE